MPEARARPVRTCVGCRRTAAKSDLVRLVWNAGLSIDLHQTAPGRGVYLHARAECVERAVRKRAIGRALRRPDVDQAVAAATVAQLLSGQPL